MQASKRVPRAFVRLDHPAKRPCAQRSKTLFYYNHIEISTLKFTRDRAGVQSGVIGGIGNKRWRCFETAPGTKTRRRPARRRGRPMDIGRRSGPAAWRVPPRGARTPLTALHPTGLEPICWPRTTRGASGGSTMARRRRSEPPWRFRTSVEVSDRARQFCCMYPPQNSGSMYINLPKPSGSLIFVAQWLTSLPRPRWRGFDLGFAFLRSGYERQTAALGPNFCPTAPGQSW